MIETDIESYVEDDGVTVDEIVLRGGAEYDRIRVQTDEPGSDRVIVEALLDGEVVEREQFELVKKAWTGLCPADDETERRDVHDDIQDAVQPLGHTVINQEMG